MPDVSRNADDGLLLQVENLSKQFDVGANPLGRSRRKLAAVDNVSFSLRANETLGVVGESGCGKSTTARMIVRLSEPTSGRIVLDGTDITRLGPRAMRGYRKDVQFIFQDPYSSLNPRLRAVEIVGEPLRNLMAVSGEELRERAAWLFDHVGLRRDQLDHLPHEFSGGQRQRLGIARALASKPRLIVADEPVSALDVSVQAQVINLMMDLQQQLGIAYLFIAHDLAVVQHISHRVAVMYLGRIVELADCGSLFSDPRHPYTVALLEAVPVPDPGARRRAAPVRGEVPSPISPPSGCTFHPRCPLAQPICHSEKPPMREIKPGHLAACHLA